MQIEKCGAPIPGSGLYGTRIPSPCQQRVIELVAQGLKNKDVAEVIGTTEYVVKNHLRVIYDKLGFWNRVELALWYEARRHERLAYGQNRAGHMAQTSSGLACWTEEEPVTTQRRQSFHKAEA
jgi:DNA-binding CsgD family transcriptional regulator